MVDYYTAKRRVVDLPAAHGKRWRQADVVRAVMGRCEGQTCAATAARLKRSAVAVKLRMYRLRMRQTAVSCADIRKATLCTQPQLLRAARTLGINNGGARLRAFTREQADLLIEQLSGLYPFHRGQHGR